MALLLVFLFLLLPVPASAADPGQIGIRAGNHPGFGRLVFDVPPGTHYRLSRDGDRVVVQFDPESPIGTAPAMPYNVRSVTPGAHEAVVLIEPGATTHDVRLGDHVVLDVFDPATGAPPKSTPAPWPPAKGGGTAQSGVQSGRPAAASAAQAGPQGVPATRAETSSPTQGGRAAPAPAPEPKPATSAVSAASPRSAPLSASGKSQIPPASAAVQPLAQAAPHPAASQTVMPARPEPAGSQSSPTAMPAPEAASSTVQAASAPKPAEIPAAASMPANPSASVPRSAGATGTKPVVAGTASVAPHSGAPAANLPTAKMAAAERPATKIPAAELSDPEERAAESGFEAAQPFAADESAASAGSLGLVARLVPPPAGSQGAAFTLPFPEGVGAAAFQREDAAYVVFDDRRPLDLAALRHNKLLWTASVHLLPSATLIRLRLPQGITVRLIPAPQGWTVAALTAAEPPAPIVEHVAGGKLLLTATAANQVVSLADPETGATLLVGTQRQSGQGIAVRRTGPEFSLLPSWQGVLVEALSDRLTLRRVADGFVLGAEPGVLAISSIEDDARTDAAMLTRRFRFADLPPEMLRQRVALGLEQAAAAPPLARGPARQAIARDMIALGMAPEAEALLHVAIEEDPKEAASPDAAGLAAIAAVLAKRPAEAQALLDPRLTGSDEVTFWRGMLLAVQDDASPQAAASFAVTAPLALDYPVAMREKLLPLVIETMLRGGQPEAAQALLARSGQEPSLAMARAMADEAAGKTDAALTAYDALANNPDQRTSARAAVQALELRLRLARISVQHAADGLERLLYAWRGDRHDLALRERLADLRQQGGDWRAALAVLRGAEQDFPAQRTEILARMQDSFAALLRNGAADRLPPLELVALVDENADLLPTSADGEALQAHLADRLLALDLPNRAGPVLEKLMRTAPTETARAGFGARLAVMRLHEGDAAGALQALLASAASGLPQDVADRRRLLFAAATAHRGDFPAALASLVGLHRTAAAALRADILEQSQDWWGADRALMEYVDRVVPAAGTLNDRQRQALLRLATAAARAGDAATLAGLNARESVRMGSGALADMFHLLTAAPVRSTSDLARARHEAGLAQTLPASLKALDPAAPR